MEPRPEIIEAAAQAACRVFFKNSGDKWDDLSPWEQDNWRNLARAALEAAAPKTSPPLTQKDEHGTYPERDQSKAAQRME